MFTLEIFPTKQSPTAGLNIKRLKEILLSMDQDDEGQKILRQTDGTTKFDALPGGEEAFRRKLNDLYHLRGEKK